MSLFAFDRALITAKGVWVMDGKNGSVKGVSNHKLGTSEVTQYLVWPAVDILVAEVLMPVDGEELTPLLLPPFP